MSAPYRFGPLALGCALTVFAAAASPALAEPQSRKNATDDAPPAFFVDWARTGPPPGLTSKPSLKKGSAVPIYPPESVRRKEEGTTGLEVCITVEGRLVNIHILKPSGFSRLDDATVTWSRTATFNPATINGDAVNVCGYPLDYVWRLNADER